MFEVLTSGLNGVRVTFQLTALQDGLILMMRGLKMKTEEKEGIRSSSKILFPHQGRMITKVQGCRAFV